MTDSITIKSMASFLRLWSPYFTVLIVRVSEYITLLCYILCLLANLFYSIQLQYEYLIPSSHLLSLTICEGWKIDTQQTLQFHNTDVIRPYLISQPVVEEPDRISARRSRLFHIRRKSNAIKCTQLGCRPCISIILKIATVVIHISNILLYCSFLFLQFSSLQENKNKKIFSTFLKTEESQS